MTPLHTHLHGQPGDVRIELEQLTRGDDTVDVELEQLAADIARLRRQPRRGKPGAR